MSRNNTTVNAGIGLPWTLTIVFMVLKLCKIINWKWIWVFAPVWISLAIALIVLIVYVIVYFLRHK